MNPLDKAMGAVPTCEVGDESVIVRLPHGADMVTFTFDEISIRSQKFDAMLTVQVDLPGADDPYRQHLAVSSGSNVNTFRLMLENYFGKEVEWKRLLPKACQMAQSNYIAASRLIKPEDVVVDSSWWWMAEKIIIGNRLNIIFGQGESAKSYLLQSMLHSATNGGEWCGRRTAGSNWIWLDYENPTIDAFAFRRWRLAQGGSVPLDGAIHWMPARGIPIPELRTTLAREIARVDAQGLVVDSLTFGCGGDPKEAALAQATSNALNSFGITIAAIAHVTKDENADQFPFGSILWHLAAHGTTWNLKRVSDEESDVVEVGWYNRKASDGGRQKSFGVRMHFNGEDGPVTIEPCDLRDVPELKPDTLRDGIWMMLESGRVAEKHIVSALKAKQDSVRKTCERMQKAGLVVPSWDGGERLWGRKSKYDDHDVM